MSRVRELSWPLADAAHVVDRLCERLGLGTTDGALPRPPRDAEHGNAEHWDDWLDAVALHREIELEPVQARYDQLEGLVRGAGPALFLAELDGEPRLIVLVRGGRKSAVLLGPDLRERRLSLAEITAALVRRVEEPVRPVIDALLDRAGVSGARRDRVRERLLRERLRHAPVGRCALMRASPGAPLAALAQSARLPQRLTALAAGHLLATAVFLASWWFIGRGALTGRVEPGWIAAWALALATLVPLRALVTWSQARIAVDVGGLLRRRLLLGALKLRPDETRHEGVGTHLGRVLESNAVEELAIGGGFLALGAAIELVLTGVVLALGAGGVWLLGLLVAWIALTLWLAVRLYRARARWTRARLELTSDLVEKMVGHRTRLAQQPRTEWYEDEDRTLARCLHLAAAMDRSQAWIRALVPRGWIVAGMAVFMIHSLLVGASLGALAVALGGILFGALAFGKLAASLTQITGAWISWRQVAHLSAAAERRARKPSVALPAEATESSDGRAARILDVRNLSFRHENRRQDVLRDVSLSVADGERLLVQGPSGEGKSTLASLLVGLRSPRSGLLLSRGIDLPSLGAGRWRRRIVGVPQFHENHVLVGTVAFNLLFGRRWPPTADDLAAADAVCRELGLGDLLDRMPGGLEQMIGETGWQLSHGEASRLFLARALLQDPDLLILDETFAALDPENLQRAFDCAVRHSRALMLIAHP